MLRGGPGRGPTMIVDHYETTLPSVYKKSQRSRDRSEDLPSKPQQRKAGHSIEPRSNDKPISPHSGPVKRDSFNFLMPVGRGSYGKVWKAVHRKSGAVYAIKEMARSQ